MILLLIMMMVMPTGFSLFNTSLLQMSLLMLLIHSGRRRNAGQCVTGYPPPLSLARSLGSFSLSSDIRMLLVRCLQRCGYSCLEEWYLQALHSSWAFSRIPMQACLNEVKCFLARVRDKFLAAWAGTAETGNPSGLRLHPLSPCLLVRCAVHRADLIQLILLAASRKEHAEELAAITPMANTSMGAE